jgi:hypothetical protein
MTGINVVAELPEGLDNPKGTGLPVVQLARMPGTFVDVNTAQLEAGRLSVACWGVDKEMAFDTAQATLRALRRLEDAPSVHGVCTAVNIDATPWWSPDPETNLPRYLFTASLFVHPLAT